MDPHPSQQHADLHHAVWQLQQEVTRPKARFKPTSPEKSGVDGGANQVPTYLGQSLHLYSPSVLQIVIVILSVFSVLLYLPMWLQHSSSSANKHNSKHHNILSKSTVVTSIKSRSALVQTKTMELWLAPTIVITYISNIWIWNLFLILPMNTLRS